MIRSTIALLTSFALIGSAPAAPTFSPHLGYSQPTGIAAQTWAAGYTLGLDYLTGLRVLGTPVVVGADFHRWEPNVGELLDVGGRDFQLEYKRGWNTLTALSARLNRHIAELPLNIGSLNGQAGLGTGYLRNSDVTVKGFAPVGDAALVHLAYRQGAGSLAPLFVAGISLRLPIHLEPTLQVQHLLHNDGFTIPSAGLNLLPRQ